MTSRPEMPELPMCSMRKPARSAWAGEWSCYLIAAGVLTLTVLMIAGFAIDDMYILVMHFVVLGDGIRCK
jgi:hypothetical protein